jgi:DNA gyrase inhibitor GyrI
MRSFFEEKILEIKGEIMKELDVRLEMLPPMRMISAYGFGSSPENEDDKKMTAFLRSKGLLEGYGTVIPHYGFNNPSPSSGSPNYGYEIWSVVPPDVEPEGDLKVVMFEGGYYAVTRFENLENIGRVWGELVQWRERSPYKEASHQWLERLHNPLEPDFAKYVFDLYLPVKK